jgi:hypothetical protein
VQGISRRGDLAPGQSARGRRPRRRRSPRPRRSNAVTLRVRVGARGHRSRAHRPRRDARGERHVEESARGLGAAGAARSRG